MHKYLKRKLPWYRQWHESWIHGPSHWVVFACAVITATMFFNYVVHSAPGQAIVESVAPAAQAASTQCTNRAAIASACTCNGVEVNNGYCCYNKVSPANQSSIVHQATACGYTEVSPHYPSMELDAYGNIYFTGGSQKKNNPPGTTLPGPSIGQDWPFIARHYDTINNMRDDQVLAVRTINPNIKLTLYQVFNEVDCVLETNTYCEEYNYFKQRAQADGIPFEDLFVHFRKTTQLTGYNQVTKVNETRTFQGWNPADDQGQCGGTANDSINDVITSCGQAASDAQAPAREEFFARVPFGFTEYWRNTSSSPYFPQDWRWRVNSKNLKYRQYNADWALQKIQTAAASGYSYDGIFVDNMGRSPYNANVISYLQAGNTVELADTNDWYAGMVEVTRTAQTLFHANGKFININAGTAESWYAPFSPVADGFVREWLIKAKTNNYHTEGRFNQNLVPAVADTKNQAKAHYLNFTMETFWDDSAVGKCFEGYTFNEEKMWSLATYYLLRYPGLSMFPGYKTWNGYYFEAMATDIGVPSADFTVWKTGLTDSAGQTYKIYRRNFTKGAVFVRFYDKEGYCPGTKVQAASAVPLDAADLAKDYRIVNSDGTLGGKPTTVSLGIADGIILQDVAAAGVPGGDITPPATVTNLTAL